MLFWSGISGWLIRCDVASDQHPGDSQVRRREQQVGISLLDYVSVLDAEGGLQLPCMMTLGGQVGSIIGDGLDLDESTEPSYRVEMYADVVQEKEPPRLSTTIRIPSAADSTAFSWSGSLTWRIRYWLSRAVASSGRS